VDENFYIHQLIHHIHQSSLACVWYPATLSHLCPATRYLESPAVARIAAQDSSERLNKVMTADPPHFTQTAF